MGLAVDHLKRNWKRYGLGLLILALFVVSFILYRYVSAEHTPVEDSNEYKVLQGENNQLREQNDSLRKDFNAAVAHGDAMELQRDGIAADMQKFGKQAADGVAKQKEAGEEYEKDISIIGVNIPIMERCQRYCTSRANAGYPCKPDADAYCKLRYSNP